MDLLNLMVNLSSVNDKSFKDTLLKRINNKYYYLLDFSNIAGNWEVSVLKIEGNSEDIVKRIRLYDQPSASKVGVSFSTRSFISKKQLLNILEFSLEFSDDIPSIIEDLKEGILIYPDNEKEFLTHFGSKVKGLSSYMTVSINGKYLVDNLNYNKKVVVDLYKDMDKKINKDDFCYVCGSKDNLIHGSFKEPAWKLVSTTRSSGLNYDGKIFLRCMECENKIMLGSDIIQRLMKNDATKEGNYERVIIPLTKDKRWFRKLEDLRKNYSSDLKFYEEVDRLFDRLEMRGIKTFLYLRIVRNQRSYSVLDIREITKEDIQCLNNKDNFIKFLKNNNWLKDTKELNYYPDLLLENDSDYKWKLIERMKLNWLGIKFDNRLWHDIENLIGNCDELVLYETWEKYIKHGDELKDVLKTRSYYLGKLMGIAIGLQEQDRGISERGSNVSIQNRFPRYPDDPVRFYNELKRVIEYRKCYLNSDDLSLYYSYLNEYLCCNDKGSKLEYKLALLEN